MGRRKKAKAAEAAAVATAMGEQPLDRGQLADCLCQTSKIATECNSILRDLLRGRSPQHKDLQRLASQVLMGQSLGLTDLQRKMESQQATLAELLKMLKPAGGGAAGGPIATDGETTAMLATYAAQQPSLSIVKGWDALNLLAAPMRRRKGQKVDKRLDPSGGSGNKRERCFGVEAYWRQLAPHQRRRLMHAPLAKMVEAVKAEQGEEGVRDLAEALMLLRQHAGRCAAFWRCPCCNMRMLDAASFVRHLQQYHEEVQYSSDGVAVQCTKCLKEVVGAYYQNEEPGFPTVVLCMACCWEEQILQSAGGDDSSSAMQLRMPQPGMLLPAPGGAGNGGGRWSCMGGSGHRNSIGGKGSGAEGTGDEDAGEEGDSSGDGEVEGTARTGGSCPQHRQQQRLQEQMELQVRATGGLLAAVAQRLDTLAAGSSSDGATRVPFEQTLLGVVAQAQRLLSMPAGAAGGKPSLDEEGRLEMQVRLAAPEAFPNQEDELQGTLGLMSTQELQCLLGYAITKHGSALGPGSGAAGGELLSSSSTAARGAAELGYSSGSSSGGSGSSSEYDSSDTEEAYQLGTEGGATTDLGSPGMELQMRRRRRAETQLLNYDPGCASVFGFAAAGEGASGQQLLLMVGEDVPGNTAGDGVGAELLCQQLGKLQRQSGSLLEDLPEGRGLSGDECLEPQPWWIDHLVHKSWHDFPADGGAEIYLLQWVYGNVAHAPTEDFLERQRLAAGPKGCDNAVMECLAELADVWRQLGGATARKRHLQSLRDNVREEVAAVRSFEGAGAAALCMQAAEFFDEVGGSGSPRFSSAGDGHWSQRALGKLQRFHQLKDESSISYAQSLIDREVAILELAEEMDLQELQLVAAEVATIDAALGDVRHSVSEAEAERQRLAAEGPAVHRRKDLLDKVNKEAEHRERLQELQQRVAAGQERILSEEGFLADARKRHDDLAADLAEVRSELAAFLERRAELDRACHNVLSAQERDRDRQLTEAHVDQRILAVWQVVTCVADAIRLLHDRYAPDAQSKEAERHIHCTGLAQGVCTELEGRASTWCADLDRLRRRAVDLACVDASAVVEAAALEVIRGQLEDAAVAAREAATLDLLRELELEEAAKKVAEGKRGKKKKKKGGRTAEEEDAEEERSAGGAGGATAKSGSSSGSSSTNEGGGASAAAVKAAAQQLLSSLDQLAPELRAELEYEAALERRRQELDAERLRKEAEMLRLAEEASLKELQQQHTGGKGGGKGATAHGGAAATVGGKSPKAAAAAVGGAKAAPGTTGKVKAAGVTAAASTGGRVITVAVAAVRGGPGRAQMLPTSPPPPPPPGSKSPVSKSAAAAPVPLPAAKVAAQPVVVAPGASGGGTKAEMRVISYYGDWRCFCGENNRLWDTCACGQIPPCRDWVRGRCTYKTRCRFAHPPFELPDSLPRPKSPIAKPSAEAIVLSSKAGTSAGRGGGKGGKGGSPDGTAVVSAIRAVNVSTGTAKSGGTGQRAVQLVKPGGRPGSTVVAVPPAAAAAVAAADTPPPPPLKPAPWAKVKPGAAVPLDSMPPPAAAAPGAPHSSFTLFGDSSPLLLPALGPGGDSPTLGGLGPEAAAAAAPPAALLAAFAGAGSLFAPDMFAPVSHAAASPAAEPSPGLLMQTPHGHPLSPMHPPTRGTMPPSPLLLSPQQACLAQAASPSTLHLSMPYLHSPQHPDTGLYNPLADLPLGSQGPAPPLAAAAATPGLHLSAYAAFHQHPHSAAAAEAAAAFGKGGSANGLDFGGNSALLGCSAFGGEFGGGGPSLGAGNGGVPGNGGGLDDWTDLQQQLPSDLGAMLGTDSPMPVLPHSPVRSPAAGQAAGETAGGDLYGASGSSSHHWF